MTTYIIQTSVASVERKHRVNAVRMVNGHPVSDIEDLGWFILFEGSHEFVAMGIIRIEPE